MTMLLLTEPCYIRIACQARCDLCDWTGDPTADELEASRQAARHRADPAHQDRMREPG
jgi:hypothetical protein